MKCNKLSELIRVEIKTWKNTIWSKKLENLSTKNNSLWKLTKSLAKMQNWTIPPLSDGDDIALSNEEKAEALAKNYEKVHKLTADFGDPKICELIKKASILQRGH